MWAGGRRNTPGTRIQQESEEQPANGDERPSELSSAGDTPAEDNSEGRSELSSVGDTPVTRLGDLQQPEAANKPSAVALPEKG